MAAVVRSSLRSATAFARSATARLSTGVSRSNVEISNVRGAAFAVNQTKAACFSTGSKRFQRIQKGKIDLKRNTPSVGIVEGVEYDASRTSRIALVRWEGGARQQKCSEIEEFPLPAMALESTTTAAVRGQFAFSSLPGTVDRSKNAHLTDILHSALCSSKAKGETRSFGFPRIAVAGAKPAFFVLGLKEREMGEENTFSLGEIRNWRPDSILWTHRNKRKAAVSWHSVKGRESLEFVRDSEQNESKTKTKMDQGGRYKKADRAPLSFILASHQLKPGMMVVNWSKPPKSNLSRWSTNAS